jgi:hypothetical protein
MRLPWAGGDAARGQLNGRAVEQEKKWEKTRTIGRPHLGPPPEYQGRR